MKKSFVLGIVLFYCLLTPGIIVVIGPQTDDRKERINNKNILQGLRIDKNGRQPNYLHFKCF